MRGVTRHGKDPVAGLAGRHPDDVLDADRSLRPGWNHPRRCGRVNGLETEVVVVCECLPVLRRRCAVQQRALVDNEPDVVLKEPVRGELVARDRDLVVGKAQMRLVAQEVACVLVEYGVDGPVPGRVAASRDGEKDVTVECGGRGAVESEGAQVPATTRRVEDDLGIGGDETVRHMEERVGVELQRGVRVSVDGLGHVVDHCHHVVGSRRKLRVGRRDVKSVECNFLVVRDETLHVAYAGRRRGRIGADRCDGLNTRRRCERASRARRGRRLRPHELRKADRCSPPDMTWRQRERTRLRGYGRCRVARATGGGEHRRCAWGPDTIGCVDASRGCWERGADEGEGHKQRARQQSRSLSHPTPPRVTLSERKALAR